MHGLFKITGYRRAYDDHPCSVAFVPAAAPVIADLRAGGPNMGVARVREVVDASNALIVETNRHMIVSGRLGTSFLPVRLGVPPEIVRVHLGG